MSGFQTEENAKMSLIKSALVAATMITGVTLAYVTTAPAQGNDPWDLKERTAYVVMMDGSMKTMALGPKGTAMLMKRAKLVKPGTAFVMSGGKLYMVDAAKMFDRAGMPTFGGGF
jgi:hypothetical protein